MIFPCVEIGESIPEAETALDSDPWSSFRDCGPRPPGGRPARNGGHRADRARVSKSERVCVCESNFSKMVRPEGRYSMLA